MQISTRDEDYLVDTLQLWRHMHVLNDPFTDPNILKVLHGPRQDIQWLQRDFSIYVVNMFDTGQAMRYLGFQRLSLAYLLKRYLDKDIDKQYQLADWRLRPLPEDLQLYAREDTHYLLYCCDMLTNELIQAGNEQKNLLLETYQQSRQICLMVNGPFY
ncbi:unnamed protein product [Soboliphyme baturini]|uniref:3'-5' exonuclease domain-containing protein n=1 Tax=Soboliphyme baturini TaxID=241478 RepID=A0A183J9L9_9BILA|nr:unnamed protein product [Soboliphyme baturini]